MKALMQKIYSSEKVLAVCVVLFLLAVGGVYAVGLSDSETDTDGDGVMDSVDMCRATIPDKPTEDLGVNHHIWVGGDRFMVAVSNKGGRDKVESEYSIQDTKGCSCGDIITSSGNQTETKFGCSQGAISNWIKTNGSVK